MEREEQLQWERSSARWAAPAAVLAAILPFAASIYASSLIGKIASDREDKFLEKLHEHSGGFIASGVITAIGTFLLAPVFYFMYRAIKARRTLIPGIALILAFAAPLVAGGVGIARQIVLTNTADTFVKQPQPPVSKAKAAKIDKIENADDHLKAVEKLSAAGRAKDKLQSGSVAAVAYVGLVSNVLLGTIFGLIGVHGMRAGVFSRFMGFLGVIVGALIVLPILGGGAPVVQLFWLVALAMLILDRWPRPGRGPAWDAVEAIPWPTAADRRDELAGESGPPRGRGRFAPADAEDDVLEEEPAPAQRTRTPSRPREAPTHPRSKKRKRKRR